MFRVPVFPGWCCAVLATAGGVMAAPPGEHPTSGPATTQAAPTLRSAGELWLAGEYESAADQYRSLAADPDQAAARLGLARCQLMTGGYEIALAELDRVAEGPGRTPAWHVLRAEVLARIGRYAEAIKHTRAALAAEPRSHRARARLGGLLELTGQREQAVEVYSFFEQVLRHAVPPTAEGMTEAARGFYRHTVLTRHPALVERTRYVLHELLQMAYERVDRNWWPARLAAADLLLSKYSLEDAAQDYRAALRINRRLPEAHVGLGRIVLEGWRFEEAEQAAEAALEINPRFVPAWTLRARSKLLERRYDEAIEACREALAVNPRDVESLALMAAAHHCRYDAQTARRYEQQALEVDPCCPLLYAVLGDALSGLRQYPRAEEAYLKSIACEPTDPNPRTELGMMYMQWGLEDKARTTLEASWALDEFNERTYNTLDLLEKLESFARLDTEHFVICYNEATEWPVARYLAVAAEEIYEEVCADYDTELSGKTIVEVFPTHRDFGVRITGKPWIHTVGACTGRVIALDAPRDHPQTGGAYDCAGVLRHEFIHTVTLELTGNRIAHWFTEGLAVYGEGTPRSFEWRRLLADAIRRDRLFTLETVDWGFIRPRRPDDRQLAYAQSEWMVEYIVHRCGYDALGRMLEGYRAARPQPEVFRTALGIEPGEFDRQFAVWARSEAAPWGFELAPPEDVAELRVRAAASPEDAALYGRLARAELDDGNLQKALDAARHALELEEAEPEALDAFVRILALMRDEARSEEERRRFDDEALPALRRLAEVEPGGWIAPKLLGDICLRREEYDEAVGWFERLRQVCPADPASYRGLTGIHLKRGNTDAALPLLLELARLAEHDAEVPAHLGRIFAARDRLGEARYWYTRSLRINAYEPATHRGLAEVHMRLGDTAEALDEYEVLCRLEPDDARHHADAAFAAHKLGDAERTRRHAARAVELDPASPAARLLLSGDTRGPGGTRPAGRA